MRHWTKMGYLCQRKLKKHSRFTKMLGVPWDKNRDNLSVGVPELITKRNVLSYIASIYDPLGLISANHFIGKVIYRELCDKKLPWDTEIPQILKKQFKKWVNDIPNIQIEIARSIPTNKESITSVDLHVFGNASILDNCAAVYAVVNQPSSISKGLIHLDGTHLDAMRGLIQPKGFCPVRQRDELV